MGKGTCTLCFNKSIKKKCFGKKKSTDSAFYFNRSKMQQAQKQKLKVWTFVLLFTWSKMNVSIKEISKNWSWGFRSFFWIRPGMRNVLLWRSVYFFQVRARLSIVEHPHLLFSLQSSHTQLNACDRVSLTSTFHAIASYICIDRRKPLGGL